jgi:hypothetical protein
VRRSIASSSVMVRLARAGEDGTIGDDGILKVDELIGVEEMSGVPAPLVELVLS